MNLPFVSRAPELLALEGTYNGIILSCRHKDILRCSITRHFHSCFEPKGCNDIQPIIYCYKPEVCIIGIKDKSGAWQARVFGFLIKENDKLVIKLSRVYGNGLSVKDIIKNISLNKMYFRETGRDIYFPLLY